jgi:hypothetical protein
MGVGPLPLLRRPLRKSVADLNRGQRKGGERQSVLNTHHNCSPLSRIQSLACSQTDVLHKGIRHNSDDLIRPSPFSSLIRHKARPKSIPSFHPFLSLSVSLTFILAIAIAYVRGRSKLKALQDESYLWGCGFEALLLPLQFNLSHEELNFTQHPAT